MEQVTVVHIFYTSDFNFGECLWFLDRNYDDCLYRIVGGEVRRAIYVNGETVLFGVREEGNALRVEILQGKTTPENLDAVTAYVREWFDLDKDLNEFYALLKKDKHLAYMPDAYRGLRLMGINDLFEALCWSIIGQQINLTFAYALKRRLVEKYGSRIVYNNEPYYLFPTYEALAGALTEDLRAMQFSRGKAEYLTVTARAFAQGEMGREILLALPDTESQTKALTKLKGIGIWTANYALMKSLRTKNSIPHGDAGLLKALVEHHIIKTRDETEKIDRFFKKYEGWESYVVFYLWRSLSVRN